MLGHVREFARSGLCTVLIITHKFREVMAYADSVTVLRRGKAVHHCRVADTDPRRLAAAMMGEGEAPPPESDTAAPVGRALHAMTETARGCAHRLAGRRPAGAGRPRHAGRARPEPRRARGRDPRRGRRLRQRPARAGRGAGRPAAAARRARDRDGRALRRAARGEPPPEAAQPARGAAAQRLRRRSQRGREHGAARLRPAAAGARRRAELRRLAQPRARVDRRVRREDARRGRADPQPLRRQCAACRAGARAGGRHQRADRGQPGVRPGLRGGARDPRPHRAGAAEGRRRAARSAKTSTNCWSWRTGSW